MELRDEFPQVHFNLIVPLPSERHPGISRDLEIIVLKCLEKEPERRYSSAAALAENLVQSQTRSCLSVSGHE